MTIVVSVLVAAGALVVVGAAVRRYRRKQEHDVCPQCGADDTMMFVEGTSTDRSSRLRMRCTNVLSVEPQFEECAFEIHAAYRCLPRLRIATAGGTVCAGQSTWHAAVGHLLLRDFYPVTAAIAPIRSEGIATIECDICNIVDAMVFPNATQIAPEPYPALWRLTSTRRPSFDALLCTFDYPGESVVRMTRDDGFRRRHLQMHGYLFFVDLKWEIDRQIEELMRFVADMREVREVSKGTLLQIPIAVCYSMIDLLPGMDPDRAADHHRFLTDLRACGPTDEWAAQDSIARRSELCLRSEQNLPGIGDFRNRLLSHVREEDVCFFAMSSVGLDGAGEPDLAKRRFEPFGVLDPLLWLIQRSGYPVLSEKAPPGS